MLYIGSDHRGFKLKSKLKPLLKRGGIEFEDLGALTLDPEDDYPVIAEKVALAVQKNKQNLGILICGSGHGVCIAANKVHGVRAGLVDTVASAQAARRDDAVNVLCLHADHFDDWKLERIVRAFLTTKYKPIERYERRLKEINAIEERN